ncbi:hypothetical protein HHI36_017790 [Cryptolaemus montrouzieri]|uniref:Uncharacterized protein n=1 Tax=Cryptolaemus montrouzieri TaxID=559131 RepID=A0ABD2NNY3_9CUCU
MWCKSKLTQTNRTMKNIPFPNQRNKDLNLIHHSKAVMESAKNHESMNHKVSRRSFLEMTKRRLFSDEESIPKLNKISVVSDILMKPKKDSDAIEENKCV